jgi:hypothetical protein
MATWLSEMAKGSANQMLEIWDILANQMLEIWDISVNQTLEIW